MKQWTERELERETDDVLRRFREAEKEAETKSDLIAEGYYTREEMEGAEEDSYAEGFDDAQVEAQVKIDDLTEQLCEANSTIETLTEAIQELERGKADVQRP